jgi:hypothetical protein
MDKFRERVRRDLHAHAAESQAETVRLYEKWAEEDRAAGRLKDAAHWAAVKAERGLRDP